MMELFHHRSWKSRGTPVCVTGTFGCTLFLIKVQLHVISPALRPKTCPCPGSLVRPLTTRYTFPTSFCYFLLFSPLSFLFIRVVYAQYHRYLELHLIFSMYGGWDGTVWKAMHHQHNSYKFLWPRCGHHACRPKGNKVKERGRLLSILGLELVYDSLFIIDYNYGFTLNMVSKVPLIAQFTTSTPAFRVQNKTWHGSIIPQSYCLKLLLIKVSAQSCRPRPYTKSSSHKRSSVFLPNFCLFV